MKILKVFNDPVHGFIQIKTQLHLDIINHRYFQKLRRIRQLGLTEFVYPGAIHSRFQHAIGAMHLIGKAMDALQTKGITISEEEYQACQSAILLHDIGHGPFSHSLEEVLLPGVPHESLSYLYMQHLNKEFKGQLELTLKIFRNSYHRPFFHSLISSQLDMDRLDYLIRDSYYTGVPEGNISVDRIIQLLNVRDEELVVEEKAIYTIENYLNARRLMYWQVYLHKTSVGSEKLITNILKRAKDLYRSGNHLPMPAAIRFFFEKEISMDNFNSDPQVLEHFSKLDDADIWGCIKFWCDESDPILSLLSSNLLKRKLLKVKIENTPLNKSQLLEIKRQVAKTYDILINDTHYFVAHGPLSNEAYMSGGKGIKILLKSGEVVEITEATDLPNIKAMSKIVHKYYQCWPKNVNLQDKKQL